MQLFFIKDVQTGLVWLTKILTDPFHDIKLYHKAPLYLLRGELIDPRHAQHGDELDEQPAALALASSGACAEAMRQHLPQDAGA